MDTFFDAGGDVSAGMVACSVVTKWAWTASYTWSVYNIVKVSKGHISRSNYAKGQFILQSLEAANIENKINSDNRDYKVLTGEMFFTDADTNTKHTNPTTTIKIVTAYDK